MLERWLIDFLGWAMEIMDKIRGFFSKEDPAPENKDGGIFPD